jgi:WD40 repeat protein
MTGVHFLNLRSRALNQSRALQGSVVGIESLQQSDTMAVAHFSGDIDLWTWRDDRIVGRLHECGSFSTSLAVGGRFLMAGCQGDDVDAWNTETGKHVGTIQGHAYIAQQFSVSDSGPILFAGSGPGRVENAQGLTTSELLLIDVVTQQTIASWKAHTAQGIYDTAITSDGRLFASCGYDGVINVWQR